MERKRKEAPFLDALAPWQIEVLTREGFIPPTNQARPESDPAVYLIANPTEAKNRPKTRAASKDIYLTQKII